MNALVARREWHQDIGTLAPALSIAGVALLAYVVTLYPDVAGGDSGELVAAVATGGLIHPPGYPLYALIGRLFVQLPHGTLAWRMNFLSAVCDSTAAGVLCFAVSRRTRCWPGGLAAAALFAFCPGVWRYAICAEVFALNNLFVALLVLLAVLYDERRERRYALCGALVLGLGLSNHHTVLFTAVPLALWMLWTGRADLLRPRVLAQLVGLVGLGLSPYVLLPIERGSHSPVSWGTIDTWESFWRHVLRQDYGTFRLAAPGMSRGAVVGRTFVAWCADLVKQLGWVGLPLAIICLATNARHVVGKLGLSAALCVPPMVAVGVMVALGNISMTDPLYRAVIARFWQQPEIFFFVSCGCGLACIERMLAENFGGLGGRPTVAVAAVGATVLALGSRARAMDHHGSTLVRSYGAEVLRIAPPGALLLTRGDLLTNVVRYLQVAEAQRADVRVVDLELLGFAWARRQVAASHPEIVLPEGRYMPGAADGFTIRPLLDANIVRAPILVCGGFKKGDLSADTSYARWPLGLCEGIRPKTEGMNPDVAEIENWLRESEAALPRIDFSRQEHAPGSWENVVYQAFLEARRWRAMHLLAVAGLKGSPRWLVGRAVNILQGIITEYPDGPAHMYKDLAFALASAGLETTEERARVATALRKFLEVGPTSSAQRLTVEQEIKRLGEVGAP
jgi:hypothetical protein